MNFSHYNGLIKNKKVHKFVFAQGNKPAAQMVDGHIDYLSETFLFKEDMDAIYEEILTFIDPQDKSIFFLEGHRFSFQELSLGDTSQIVIYPQKTAEIVWADLLIPGYVNDWVEAGSGVIVFYGSDVEFLQRIRLSFAQKRTEIVKGSSIVFTSTSSSTYVSKEGHFLTTSINEDTFLSLSSKIKFDAYSFKSDILKIGGSKVLRIADKGSLVILNSHWSDISKVWSELYNAFENESMRDFFFDSVIGLIGVKQADSNNIHGEVVFEAFPMLNQEKLLTLSLKNQLKEVRELVKKEGVSFNQSLHSLVLKRKLSLDSAYKISSDPEELNKFLSECGV